MPIKHIGITYDVYETIEQRHIWGNEVIKAIVKNITDGTERSINRYGEVNNR